MISKIIANTRKHGQLTRVESLVCSILIAIVAIDAFEDPKFQLLPKDIGVLVGSTVDFTCSIINPGAINSILDKTIKWCKNGYPVRTGILPGTPSGLHVVNIQPTDEYGCGIDGFLCKETTKLHFVTALSITTSTTATTTTTTTALPSKVTVDLFPSKSTIYDQDKSVSLTCTVTSPATTTLTISWYRDAFQLDHTSSRVKTTSTPHSGTIFTGSLTFNTIYHRDMGNYFCKVSEDGHVGREKNIQLTVFYRPIVQISPLTSSIDTRSPVYLTCRVANLKEIEKNADVSLEWCKNGHSLTLSGGETFTTKERGHEVLEVRRVTADVTYSCGVESCSSISANVFVLKPNTPTCPQSDDRKSNTWNHTKAGETMYKVCPVAYVGKISRECHTDSSWGDLKDINCVNKTLLSLFDRLENINESLEPTDVIVPTLKQLYRFVSDKAKLITAGDLNMVVNILQKIADIMNETKYIVQQLTSLNFVRTVAEILSLGKEPDWSQVHREIDPMKAATLMNIVKTFGLSVGRHINKSIDFTTNTFALQINKTHPETITLSPNNAHTPTLTVSKNSLTNAAGGDRELLVLTAVYNTLHRFLNAQVTSPGSILKNPHGQKLAPPLFSVSVYIYFNSSMKEVTDMKPSVTMTAPPIRRVKQMCCIQTENSTFICPAEPKDGVCEYSITGNLAITQEAVEDLVIMATKIVIGIIMVYIILLSIGNIYILRYLQLSDAKNVTMLFAFGIFTFGSTSAENLERCQTIGVFLTFFFVTTGFLSCSSSILMLINMRQNVGNTKVNQAPVDKLDSPEEEQEVLQGKQIGPKTCVNANCALQLGMTLGSYGLSAFIVGTYVGVMTSEGFVTDTKCLPSVKNGAVYILVCPMCTMLLLQVFFSIISDVCSSKEGNKSEEKNSESKGEKRCVGRRCMAITEGLEQFLEIFGIVWAALTDDYIDVCTTICTFILAISKGVRDAPILNEIRKRMNKKFRLCRTKKDESDKERKKVEDIEMEVKGKENPDVVDKGNIDIDLPISENTSFGPSSAPVDSVMHRM